MIDKRTKREIKIIKWAALIIFAPWVIRERAIEIYNRIKITPFKPGIEYVAQCTRCNAVSYDADAVYCPKCAYATLEEVNNDE